MLESDDIISKRHFERHPDDIFCDRHSDQNSGEKEQDGDEGDAIANVESGRVKPEGKEHVDGELGDEQQSDDIISERHFKR